MWETPKTNWQPTDYFNAEDYNRIKNNIVYVRDIAKVFYEYVELLDIEDKVVNQYIYATDFNRLVSNLQSINAVTINEIDVTEDFFFSNGVAPYYIHFNKWENLILEIYNRIKAEEKQMLGEKYVGEDLTTGII